MADYNTKPQSRSEEILRALIDGDQYNKKAQSRIEYLLKQLIEVLDGKADLDEDGLIPVSELPPVVFEHMMEVVDDTARFALTTDDVQNGDYVYVDSSNIMYFVIDDTKLDMEAGYKPVAAGIAAKAVGDKNGNDITTTYQPKIDSQHNLDADLVDDSTSTNKFVTATDKTTWNGKQDALTFDSAPTASSTNPVTSGGVYTALADKQGTIDSTHKLSSDLVDDTNNNNKFVTATDKTTWNGKQDAIDSTHKLSSDLVDDTTSTNKFVTAAEKTSIGTSAEKLTGVAETDDNYIEMENGVRLYISNTAPTGTIPEGSIGIGW